MKENNFLIFVISSILTFSVNCFSQTTIYVDDDLSDNPSADFTTIQEAIDAANGW